MCTSPIELGSASNRRNTWRRRSRATPSSSHVSKSWFIQPGPSTAMRLSNRRPASSISGRISFGRWKYAVVNHSTRLVGFDGSRPSDRDPRSPRTLHPGARPPGCHHRRTQNGRYTLKEAARLGRELFGPGECINALAPLGQMVKWTKQQNHIKGRVGTSSCRPSPTSALTNGTADALDSSRARSTCSGTGSMRWTR